MQCPNGLRCVLAALEGPMMRVGGVEFGGTKVRCIIGVGPGSIARELRIPTRDPGQTLGEVLDFFRSHSPMPQAIGVGSFGPLDLVRGRIAHTPKPGWSGVDIRGALESLGVPVVLDTDVAAALAGELRWGAAQGVEKALYLTVGTGIGGAIDVGVSAHPEMGHIPIPRLADDPLQRGVCRFHEDCWEGWASGPALAARYGVPTALPADHPAWSLEARYLAQGIRSLTLSLMPDLVIVGGGVGLRPGMLEQVQTELDVVMDGCAGRGPSASWLVTAGLGEDAGLFGAMALAMSQTD